MQQNALKSLAQKAKKRLSSAGQTIKVQQNEKSVCSYLSPTTYKVVATRQQIEEDPLYEKVKLLLSKDEVYNPLAELTDYSVFNNLSSPDKERYILQIATKYNELKDYFSNFDK